MSTKLSSSTGKIGVLDSGVGGLSVLREIHALLPDVPTLYFADQKNVPYGPRPPHEIRQFIEAITRFLIDQGAVTVVIACNSASAAGLKHLRILHPEIPIVGMEPAVKPAVEASKSGVIGVLTTQATANGTLYRNLLERFSPWAKIITQVAPELVRIAEAGCKDTPDNRQIILNYVQPMIDQGADQIALACTHFPFLKTMIHNIVGSGVNLIDNGPAVARQVAKVLPRDKVDLSIQNTEHRYYTSGSAEHLQTMLQTLINVDTSVTALPDLQFYSRA
ncbi:MAG TPA: glutamate racemase [Phototrophicaceae bacterium]|nr:glutamate racemase [Phototrophicaceae bacterium]